MRVLLDTNVILRQLGGLGEIGADGRRLVEDADQVMVSSISLAEIGVKQSMGKLPATPGLLEHLTEVGLRILPLGPSHGLHMATLPLHHRDPFDRLLIAQASLERLHVLTTDETFLKYDIAVTIA